MPAKIHGRLGALDLASSTNASAYSVPANRKATTKISFCNRNSSDVSVRLAMIDGAIGTLANEDYLVFDSVIPANGFLSYEGVTVSAGHTIMARASNTGVSVLVHGVEEDA